MTQAFFLGVIRRRVAITGKRISGGKKDSVFVKSFVIS